MVQLDIQPLLKFVKRYYDEPHRCYHNFQHVQDVLRAHHAFFAPNVDIDVALIMHDFVYVPTSKYNEEQSASMVPIIWPLVYGEEIDPFRETLIRNLIMATKFPSAMHNVNPLLMESVMQDCDLIAFCAEDYSQFVQTQTDVLSEYPFATPGKTALSTMLDKSAAFLGNVLTTTAGFVYKTREMEHLNDRARNNISRFVKEFSSTSSLTTRSKHA